MKGHKKKEYRLEVNIYDTITTSVIISEATYKKKLMELKQKVEETQPGPEEEKTDLCPGAPRKDMAEKKRITTDIRMKR